MTIHDQPTHTFEDRLLTELRAVVAERPEPAAAPAAAPARARRRLVRPAAALGTTATVAAIAALATSGSPAYAVESNADGTVTVEINYLKDAAGLERDLAKVGVTAVVDFLPADTVCKEGRFTSAGSKSLEPIRQGFKADGTGSITLTPSDLRGSTLVFTSAVGQQGGQLLSTLGIATGAVKPCEPVAAKAEPLPPLPATKDGKLHTQERTPGDGPASVTVIGHADEHGSSVSASGTGGKGEAGVSSAGEASIESAGR